MAKNQKTLFLPLNTLGNHSGPPAVPPHWLKRPTGFFWPALLVKNMVAWSLETWLNS